MCFAMSWLLTSELFRMFLPKQSLTCFITEFSSQDQRMP
jgi:hypothetical protein